MQLFGQLVCRCLVSQLLLCFAIATPVAAGISADNVIVVVNSDSHDSLTIANHYIQLRGIPSGNIVFLSDIPDGLRISLSDFHTKILEPLLDQINARRLAGQARVIAYSSGFPTSVDISAHTSRLTDEIQKKYQTPLASLNSMTYFYRFVIADDPSYLNWYSNLYARSTFDRNFINPFAGEKGERFKTAKAALESGDAANSGKTFRELFMNFPTLSPLAIMAAEAYVKAEDRPSAIQMTAAALRSGWTSRKYLDNSESLSTLLDQKLVQRELHRTRDYPSTVQYPIGFSSQIGWTSSGCPVKIDAGGMPYLLSCSLAVVHPNASTLEQAIEVLRRSSTCDRSFPDADVRFSKTSDVRTKTRFPGVADALIWLNNKDVKTQIFPNAMSTSPGKCVGMMLGTATMELDNVPFEFVPGAIAENLTSLGAAFETPNQTKLTALLHAGAAMSSGAVTEPYSLQPKFPQPLLYPYYIEGVSAIEAFYLATTSPYQLLIVGDPLAQPFARASPETVSITTEPGNLRRIVIERTELPQADAKRHMPTEHIELLANGVLFGEFPSPTSSKFTINVPDDLEGMCEITVVLISDPVLQTRITTTKMLKISDVDVVTEATKLSPDQIEVRVKCEGANNIVLYCLGMMVGEADGAESKFTIKRSEVGAGPLHLQAIAFRGEHQCRSKIFFIE